MSEESIRFAGVLLITVPTIAFGGAMLLRQIWGRDPGYLDNPVRQNLWRAGHAHAGVLIILALVGMLLMEHASLSSGVEWLVRYTLVAAPILMPLGSSSRSHHPAASGRTGSSTWYHWAARR